VSKVSKSAERSVSRWNEPLNRLGVAYASPGLLFQLQDAIRARLGCRAGSEPTRWQDRAINAVAVHRG